MSAPYLEALRKLQADVELEAEGMPFARGPRPAAAALAIGLWKWRDQLIEDARLGDVVGRSPMHPDPEPLTAQDFPLLDLMERRA